MCCKLIEHIIHSQVISHLERHNILADEQHGFRKKRSCESQLINTVHDLAKGLNSKQQIDAVLFDFSKAFDKVPHHRLALKLQHYGVRGKTLEWIRSFLADRTQQVVVDGETSRPANVSSGVPQGTVLGPLLFLVYRIAGNFRWVLIFAISRIGYGVAKIKTAIIYSNRNSKVGSFEIAKIKIVKIISHTFTLKSRKFSSAKISRYTVYQRSSVESKFNITTLCG